MKGKIGFEGLRVDCLIGCQHAESIELQPILIDLKIETNISSAVQTDHIDNALDYVQAANICKVVAQKHHHLLETLASAILDRLCAVFKIERLWIKIRKPQALPEADCSFVEIER